MSADFISAGPALPESDPSDEMDYIFIGSLAWLIMTAKMEGTTFLLLCENEDWKLNMHFPH